MSKQLVAESFTNEFGQVINPGDEVVYVGTGYSHSVRVNRGKFAGVYREIRRQYVYENGQYVKDENGRPKFEMKEVVSAVRVDGVKSKRWNYNYTTKEGKYTDTVRCAILPLKRVYKIETPLSEMAGTTL